MIRPTLLVIGLFTAFLLVPAAQAEDANDWISRGQAALDARQYADALTYYDKALALEKNSASAWSGKAVALNNLGDYSGALNAASNALAVNAKNERAVTARAYAYFRLMDYNESVYAYDALFSMTQVNTAEPYCNQAYALWQLNRNADAAAAYRKCTSFNPLDTVIWNNLGLIYMDLKDYEHALSAFDSGTKLASKNATLWNNKGKALVELGRPGDARECFYKALGIDPGFTDAKDSLARLDGQLQVYQVTGTVTITQTLNRLGTTATTAPSTQAWSAALTPEPTISQPFTTIPVTGRTTYSPLSPFTLVLALLGATAIALLARRD